MHLIEPAIDREHVVLLILIAAQQPIVGSARLRVVIVLVRVVFAAVILLLLQLECLLYVESGHLDLVLHLDGIVLLLLLLHHSLFTLDPRGLL